MGKKIVIDTCVAIDLNTHLNDFLEEVLNCLGDDEIYISKVNFEELDDYKTANVLRRSQKVYIKENNEEEFINFQNEIEPLSINLENNDAHVLFLAKNENADYVVSSDLNVFKQTSKYRKCTKYDRLVPFTTVDLLNYLYKTKRISGSAFSEKTLNLFKNKEIDNVFNHMVKEENLRCTKPEQVEIVKAYKKMLKERFEMYKRPIVDEFKYLWSLRIQT